MKKAYTDRSRIIQYQRCPRARFHEYHDQGTGLVSKSKPLPLAVGGSVHKGIETLLRLSQGIVYPYSPGIHMVVHDTDIFALPLRDMEEQAVRDALADFSQYSSALELDATELNQMTQQQQPQQTVAEQLAQSLGMSADDPMLEGLTAKVGQNRAQFDQYLAREQAALVEGLVRAYARRRLVPLLEQYEVLEVEREGQWKLAVWSEQDSEGELLYRQFCETCGYRGSVGVESRHRGIRACPQCHHTSTWEPADWELWFMSRPDALLRDRESNELYILSLKTTGAWDVRKDKDIQHDMQGLTEGVEIEQRLGKWWQVIQGAQKQGKVAQMKVDGELVSMAMVNYLGSLPAPARILGIRYEFILKGERWKDKDLTSRFQMECRTQRSHLIRRYVAHSLPQKKGPAGFALGDQCWSWDYLRPEDQRDSNLAWQNWKGEAVWESGSVRDWIDKLDTAAEVWSGEDSTVGLQPRLLGWKCDAQGLGITKEHPLDSVFVPPIVIYRNSDELRDVVEQIEAQERGVVEHLVQIEGARDEGERRSLLNQFFPQSRHACEYPSTCQYAGSASRKGICWAGDDAKRDPLGTGEYVRRVPNHPIEGEK